VIEESVNTKYNSPNSHVLVCLVRDPEARLRDIAAGVGITERAVQKIVRDLQDGGMVSVTKSGRRNCYRIHKKQTLRHDLEANCTLGDLVKLVSKWPIAHQSTAEAETIPAAKSPSIEPRPVKHEPDIAATAKVEPGKVKSGKSRVSDSKERQQGSLF